SDIRFAPQVVDQRNPCAAAWSPHGEVIIFGQRRPRHRGLEKSFGITEFIPAASKATTLKSGPNLNAADENVDDPSSQPSSTSGRKRGSKSIPGRSSNSRLLGSTPEDGSPPVLSLATTVSRTETTPMNQNGAIGNIQGATFDPAVFRYLAKNYSKLLVPTDGCIAESDPMARLCQQLDNNATHAENVSMYRLAQAWRIIKYVIEQQITANPVLRADERPQKRRFSVDESMDITAQKEREKEKEKNTPLPPIAEVNNSPQGSPVPAKEPEGLQSSHPPAEIAPSTVAPRPPSPPPSLPPVAPSHQVHNSLLSHQARPLSANANRRSTTELTLNTGPSNLSEVKPSACQIIDEESVSPRSFSPEPTNLLRRDFLSEDLLGQRSAPRNITGRLDWHETGAEDAGPHEGDFDLDKLSLAESPNIAKLMLSRSVNSQSSRLYKTAKRHDSTESFRLFSTSTDSSIPTKSVAGSYSPSNTTNLREEMNGLPIRGGSIASMRNDQRYNEDEIAIGSPPKPERQDTLPTHSSFGENVQANSVHLRRPSSPLPFLWESATKRKTKEPLADSKFLPKNRDGFMLSCNEGDSAGFLISADAQNRPWSVQNLLKQAIMYYCSTSPVDIQSAAHFLHKLHMIFPLSEHFLPQQQRDYIFRAYNEILLRQQMFTTAAELRLLCVRAYPSVYDYAQKETFINVYCFTCKKPFENPVRDNTRCHRCQATQSPCTICESLEPPQEWVEAYAAYGQPTGHEGNDIMTRPHGAALWSWCQGCGHGAHTACQVAWLSEVGLSEGGCPTPGCMHDCGWGELREYHRTYQVQERRVLGASDASEKSGGFGFTRRDSWANGESKAVERVRRILGVAPGSKQAKVGDRDAALVDGPFMAAKKVRLMAHNR
ncbi:SEA (Seh1-associated) complex subunit, partial [Ascosphaera aggregata]